MLRWDEVYLTPASPIGHAAFDKVREQLEVATVKMTALAKPGDTLVLDNWRRLHSRPAIPAGREGRHLERIYLRRLN